MGNGAGTAGWLICRYEALYQRDLQRRIEQPDNTATRPQRNAGVDEVCGAPQGVVGGSCVLDLLADQTLRSQWWFTRCWSVGRRSVPNFPMPSAHCLV